MADLRFETDPHGVAWITIARAERKNVFDAELIDALTATVSRIEPATRAVVLASEGDTFCAGADLKWMKSTVDYGLDRNTADSRALAAMFQAFDDLPMPLLARVQGAALGGGAGLVAVADIAVASTEAVFGFTEVRVGILPAVVSPYVVRKIGPAHATALFTSGIRFDARRAQEIGLVEAVEAPEELDAKLGLYLDAVVAGGPNAVKAAKRLVRSPSSASPRCASARRGRRACAPSWSDAGRAGTRDEGSRVDEGPLVHVTVVLVANRGEIARRIFRTARRLGFGTAAAYSDADAALPFVREADSAVRLGPAPARESYLDIERILAAARETGAELVHPGYGFLAESPAFAAAVAGAGLRFVGPPPAVLTALGDKAQAKELAHRAGVPVLPGHWSEDQRDAAFIEAARRIGYPVMVKPVAGGGGIGMQRVREETGLRDALAKARRIASASFGDERLLLERLVERPRHVEVQILADAHGTIAALGERDCSTQRRHQKVLEETPAPALDERQRKTIAEAAVAVAREAKYLGAGTVEFAVDDKGAFFFLEVNARLQVEHPVTELVWDVDLVEQQLRIAQGERLALREPAPRGHAIEVRLYAEDVAAGFLPSTGRLLHVRWPEGVRVDAGYEEGNEVTRHYDPLVAKIIAHGPHRKLALAKLDEALASTEVLGVRTNLPFLRALARHPAVQRGRIDTELVGRDFEKLLVSADEARSGAVASGEAIAVAACAVVDDAGRSDDPWSEGGAFRIGTTPSATVVLHDGAREHVARVTGSGPYAVADHLVARDPSEAHAWTLDGAPAAAARDGSRLWVGVGGHTYEVDTAPPLRALDAARASEVAAPMPGVVIGAQARPRR